MKAKTIDNFLINLWDIVPKSENKNKVTIILCGSDSGNMSYLLRESLTLANYGYNVITFDYRGFGQSQDFKIDTTLMFHNEFLMDFEAIVEYARKQYPGNKIGTLGFSMGGYFPLITKNKLDFMMADSPLISPLVVLQRLNKKNLKLPKDFIEPIISQIAQLYFIGSKDKIIHFDDVPSNFAVLFKGNHLESEIIMGNNVYIFMDSFLSNL